VKLRSNEYRLRRSAGAIGPTGNGFIAEEGKKQYRPAIQLRTMYRLN
jgi:hypothetical protein